jgi:DNA polymerase I-like protein with 3'-5' exonuclease and polymerase domains
MISLDTETTGVDLHHGVKPFIVTTCNREGVTTCWEWDVDPFTREPAIPQEELAEIDAVIAQADELVLQNPKFDARAMHTIGLPKKGWPWKKTKDTLLAGHLLASHKPHDLTSMTMQYLGVDIEPYEKRVQEACNAARTMARNKAFIEEHGQFLIAKAGLACMPSAKDTVWKFDMWLPRAIAKLLGYPKDHPWWTVTLDYANADSTVTIALIEVMEALLKEHGLWEIYLERLKVLPVAFSMEQRGITVSEPKLSELTELFTSESKRAATICTNIARGYDYDLVLPKNGTNNSLSNFLFGEDVPCVHCEGAGCIKCDATGVGERKQYLDLPVVRRSKKTQDASLNKEAMEQYASTLPTNSKGYLFVKKLREKRKRDTALSYMDSYRRFWHPWVCVELENPVTGAGWYVLHPSLNPTGTATLRWSSSNPNEQNISKQEGFNLRYCFGPAPGREWWSCDAKNIELRIPAYEAGETEMINLFERPNDPPYFGSNHLLAFDIIHPELFAKHGAAVKELFDSTWYQYTKNGNFAVQYGSVEESGTADRAYHVVGAFNKIKSRFKKIHGPGGLNERMIAHAERFGYVETMPDLTVNPHRGYPLYCTRTEYGRIKPTVPLNYHTQGTAMWWMQKAMVRCHTFLEQLNSSNKLFQQLMGRVKTKLEASGYFLIMQVHDELVFDFPKGTGPKPYETNLPIMRRIQTLMEEGGKDIGVPTPVSCKYHAETWSKGLAV